MIRQFKPGDEESCSELSRACIRHDMEIPSALRLALLEAESPRSMLERGGLFYMAVWETEGKVVALGGLDMNEIRLLVVSPAYQRRGIGRAVLEHLEAMVPPALFKNVFVYSALSAAGFYRARGYSPQGEHYFDLGDYRIPTIYMTKMLPAGRDPRSLA